MMRRAQPWLGTLVEITVADVDDDNSVLDAMTRGFEQVALVHGLMSFHDAASDVSRINRAAAGERLVVHPHTCSVLQLAQTMHAMSEGIFNIGCAPKMVEWAYLPNPCSSLPDYRPRLCLLCLEDDGSVTKTADGWIDLGGIAKGYAVDLAIELLAEAGIKSACVNAGGDLRVIGDTPYPVAIRSAEDPSRMAGWLTLNNEAMATSATYFSARVHGGQSASMLLNGRTGEPIVGTVSASVCAKTCAIADALTKVIIASGDPKHPALTHFGATAMIL